MTQTVIASPKHGDDGTIQTVGSQATDMQATNLQIMQPSSVWRATDLNNAYIEIQLDGAQDIDFVGLLYHNLSSSGTVRVRAAASQANLTASPAYDSTALSGISGGTTYDRNHFLLFISSTQTYEWWRIDISDSGNSDGYVQAGRLYISDSYQPSRNIRFGWAVTWIDGQTRTRALGGQTFPRQRDSFRRFNASLRVQDASELWDNIFQIQRLRGTAKDVVFAVDKDNTARLTDWTVMGLFTDNQPMINETFNLYQINFTVEELL